MSDSVLPYELYPARLLCPRILQGRILEWVAIPFSRGLGWKSTKGLPSWNSCRTRQEPVLLSKLEQQVGKILKLSCESTGRGLLVHYHKVILPHQNSNEFRHLVFMTGIPRKNEAKSTQLLGINVVQGEDELGIGHETSPPSSSSPVPPQVRLRQTNNSKNSFCCPEFSIS